MQRFDDKRSYLDLRWRITRLCGEGKKGRGETAARRVAGSLRASAFKRANSQPSRALTGLPRPAATVTKPWGPFNVDFNITGMATLVVGGSTRNTIAISFPNGSAVTCASSPPPLPRARLPSPISPISMARRCLPGVISGSTPISEYFHSQQPEWQSLGALDSGVHPNVR